jgi:hypothetical protein
VTDRLALLLEIILAAAWLGAAIFFSAVVAQAAFAVLPSRTLAGALVGDVLPVLFFAGMALGLVIVLLEGVWGRGWGSSRSLTGLTTIATCAVAQFIVGARIERARSAITGPLELLAPDDPRRIAFGRLHMISVAWLGAAIVTALVVLVLATRQMQSRR